MISKELISHLAEKTGIQQKELIEKDLILHKILCGLAGDSSFSANYAFKGGTCLIKCYFGYYRFSEDLDFTWVKQEQFQNKSEKRIRKSLSAEISSLLSLLNQIADDNGLGFKPDKKDKRYVQFGGSNKFLTCKLWYNSVETGMEQFIKVQVNYREKLEYKTRMLKARSLISGTDASEIAFLFPGEEAISQAPTVKAYDIKETYLEKIRAILTRQGVKPRDYVDAYLISKKGKISLEAYRKKVINKTLAMLQYEKYLKNLQEKANEALGFKPGEEKALLLKPLGEDFPKYVEKLNKQIQELIRKILDES